MRNTSPPLRRRHRNEIAKTNPYAIHKPNKIRVKHGIPRWLRAYCKRYGKGIDAMLQEHVRYPV